MKTLSKLEDEIPQTKEGLRIYIKELEKTIKPVRVQFNRMDTLLEKAKEFYKKL